MGKKRFKTIQEYQRVAALPYNPYLEEEVQKIRQKYALPTDSEEACRLFELFRPAWALSAPNPLMQEGKPKPYTRAPFEPDIAWLVDHFKLPRYVFARLLEYILSNDKRYLGPWAFNPMVNLESDMRTGLPRLNVGILGLPPWFTKEQWDRLWYRAVKPTLERHKRDYEGLGGIAELSTRASTIASYSPGMKLISELHRLHKIEGLSLDKALEKWQKDHPDKSGRTDHREVYRAIKEFHEIVHPYSD